VARGQSSLRDWPSSGWKSRCNAVIFHRTITTAGANPRVVVQEPVAAATVAGSAHLPTSGPLPLLDQGVGKWPFVLIIAPRPGRLFGRSSHVIGIYLTSEANFTAPHLAVKHLLRDEAKKYCIRLPNSV